MVCRRFSAWSKTMLAGDRKTSSVTSRPFVIPVAPATAANQLRAARLAADALGPVSEQARLVVTHGNGPQVGLLALKEDSYGGDSAPRPAGWRSCTA
jgi:hypothetical protein